MLPGSGGTYPSKFGVTRVTGVTHDRNLLYLLNNIDVTPTLRTDPEACNSANWCNALDL